jgi:hypothetical protein
MHTTAVRVGGAVCSFMRQLLIVLATECADFRARFRRSFAERSGVR